mgnify:CR=1 FL=1
MKKYHRHTLWVVLALLFALDIFTTTVCLEQGMFERNALMIPFVDLVKQYHYLGYQNLLGHRLKYLALSGTHPVAALSWSAAALKVGVRDRFIGWSEEQKKTYLDRIANNSRFLIFPWVLVPHLASHVLSLNIRRLARDWEQQFHHPLWLLETFVDPSRFKGTSYKAANWKGIGQTLGMRAWRIRLVSSNDLAVSWPRCLLRFLVGLVSLGLIGLGIFWALLDSRNRCWHDLAARTLLVRSANR